MEKTPQLRIVHQLPGRVRIKLDLLPKSGSQMEKIVKGHPGILEVRVSPITKSLLLKFEPEVITQEELIIRIAVLSCFENNFTPIRVYSDVEVREMSNMAFMSGFFIVCALGGKVVSTVHSRS